MTTKSDTVRTKVAVLLGETDPALTHAKIAEMAACSKKTVQRIAHSIRPELQEVEAKLEAYGTLLRDRLPVSERVGRYVEIARGKANPFAAMRALGTIDRLDGIEVDELKDREPAAQQPVFALPPGSNTAVTIARQAGLDSGPTEQLQARPDTAGQTSGQCLSLALSGLGLRGRICEAESRHNARTKDRLLATGGERWARGAARRRPRGKFIIA
jgi:hypothetical protein